MNIVEGTNERYAHVELDDEDRKKIRKLRQTSLPLQPLNEALEGLEIEVSQHDLVPDAVRKSLVQGKYFRLQ